VIQYQKGITNLDFTEARVAVASAGPYGNLHLAHLTQITTPAPHHSVFYRPDALLSAQPTALKH